MPNPEVGPGQGCSQYRLAVPVGRTGKKAPRANWALRRRARGMLVAYEREVVIDDALSVDINLTDGRKFVHAKPEMGLAAV